MGPLQTQGVQVAGSISRLGPSTDLEVPSTSALGESDRLQENPITTDAHASDAPVDLDRLLGFETEPVTQKPHRVARYAISLSTALGSDDHVVHLSDSAGLDHHDKVGGAQHIAVSDPALRLPLCDPGAALAVQIAQVLPEPSSTKLRST